MKTGKLAVWALVISCSACSTRAQTTATVVSKPSSPSETAATYIAAQNVADRANEFYTTSLFVFGDNERPALISTQPVTPEVEAQWGEDLKVMDKLLSDQLSRAKAGASPQAMGIKLMSFGGSDPLYIEGFGALFSYRVSMPLAKGKGSTTQPAVEQKPSAWDRAKHDLENRQQWGGVAMFKATPGAQRGKVTREPFAQDRLDDLIADVVKILPEAKNIRNLGENEFVTITMVGTDDAGAAKRLTLKASKADIDAASSGKITAEEFASRVARRVG